MERNASPDAETNLEAKDTVPIRSTVSFCMVAVSLSGCGGFVL